jgi:hypothetical protein
MASEAEVLSGLIGEIDDAALKPRRAGWTPSTKSGRSSSAAPLRSTQKTPRGSTAPFSRRQG